MPGHPAIRAGCRKLVPLALRRLKEILDDKNCDPRHHIAAVKAVFDGAQRESKAADQDGSESTSRPWVVRMVPDWKAPGK